jgi:hypothetical protein
LSLEMNDGSNGQSSSSMSEKPRPFYFNLVVWGERYCRYVLENCVASLLSPRNIPLLDRARGSKFLFATHAQDWKFLSAAPIFARLAEYVEPVFLELPAAPPPEKREDYFGGTLTYNLGMMGIGHQLISERAFRDRAYGVYLAPDSMLSDGSVENLDALARNGIELVLCSALRLAEEPFFEGLGRQGIRIEESLVHSGEPLIISGRQMVRAAIAGLHPETLTYEWDAQNFFAALPSAIWWAVPGEQGLLVHCLNWMPLLFDFAAVKEHDASALQNWTLDGDYVYKNLGNPKKKHVVQDSDEIFMASWAPIGYQPHDGDITARRPRNISLLRRKFEDVRKGVTFRDGFYSGIYFDPLKQEIFFLPVRWHANSINTQWRAVEKRSQAILRDHVVRPKWGSREAPLWWCVSQTLWRIGMLVSVVVPIRIGTVAQDFWKHRDKVGFRIVQMLKGDGASWQRAGRRASTTFKRVFLRGL